MEAFCVSPLNCESAVINSTVKAASLSCRVATWTSTRPLERAQSTDLDTVSSSSPDRKHQYSPQSQHGAKTPPWPSVAAQAMHTKMVCRSSMDHRQHSFQV